MTFAARRARVTGRVQGVWFRAWTKGEADALGLSGWVRNCADGSVEAHVEGEPAAIDALVERLREGPPAARVDAVEVSEGRVEGVEGFVVRRD